MKTFSEAKRRVAAYMDAAAAQRERYLRRNWYYYRDMLRLMRFLIPPGSAVLEIGCGVGNLLGSLSASPAVGIDISHRMLSRARARGGAPLRLALMDAEHMAFKISFDVVIISDTMGYLEDIQAALRCVYSVCKPQTRLIITYHSFLWQPMLRLAEKLRLKMPQERLNWLNIGDIRNLLSLEGFEIIKEGRRLLCPRFIPLLSWFANHILAHLSLLHRFCITGFVIARRRPDSSQQGTTLPSVSVVVPARNERGTIAEIVRRMPVMGSNTEVIFVEGHSSDGTLDEIKHICASYRGPLRLRWTVQEGSGKADAVRRGFSLATGDVFMILDADVTVRPEDLPKFFDALACGRGEFINGTRLVYPMEREAMPMLNMVANKFFSIVFSWLLCQPIKDTLCGTKALARRDWERIVALRSWLGEFDPFGDFDLLFGAAKLNLKIVEIPVRYMVRRYGSTNIARFRQGLLLLKMALLGAIKLKFF